MNHRLAPAVESDGVRRVGDLGALTRCVLLKGHGHYVAVVWARDALLGIQLYVLAVLPDWLRATVEAFLGNDPGCSESHGEKRVRIDMWEGYAGAVAAALPQVQVVMDWFHVAVDYQGAFDELRQAECRRLNVERPPERAVPTAELRPLLRREWRSLNPDQQGKVVELFEQTPTLASADAPRTLLTAIFDSTPDWATAERRLQLWVEQVKASGLSCFDNFINTLHNWQDGILNYFDGRHTSGFVEGLDNNSSCSTPAFCLMTRKLNVRGPWWYPGSTLWA